MTRKIIYLAIVALAAFIIWKQVPQEVATSGKPLIEVIEPQLSALGQAGKPLFDENCSACHGENAAGVDGSGPPLIHKVYEPNHHGDGAFLIAVKNGVRAHHWRFGDMPPVEGVNEDTVRKIITYIREVQKANNIF